MKQKRLTLILFAVLLLSGTVVAGSLFDDGAQAQATPAAQGSTGLNLNGYFKSAIFGGRPMLTGKPQITTTC